MADKKFPKLKTLRRKKFQIRLSMSKAGGVDQGSRKIGLTMKSKTNRQQHKFRSVQNLQMTRPTTNRLKKHAQMHSVNKITLMK